MSELSIQLNQNIINIEGELTRHTLTQITNKALTSLLQHSETIVDLQQVVKVDTAGLAWLFYLLEQAQKANCQLRFTHLPTKLNNLIKLSGVERFLPN